MFVSTDGSYLISGQPGVSARMEIEKFLPHMMTLPKGLVLSGAEFSPDSLHVTVQLLAPEEKKQAIVITNNKLGDLQSLPSGFQFLRWLENDKVLLKGSGGLTIHKISGNNEDTLVDTPEGWSGTVIPETNTQILVSKERKLAVKRGSQPLEEVLTGTDVAQFIAVADDFSLFGGVDKQKRFWVQHGLGAKPEIVATGVERVLWGPISRRAVVQEEDGESRVYDGRDGTWIDLGSVSGAVWSQDENRLLFVETGPNGGEGFLSLLIGREILKLCPTSRIGSLAKAFIPANDDTAFLLAGLSGGLEVWMTALPPRTASKL
jgi:hypothetical protein